MGPQANRYFNPVSLPYEKVTAEQKLRSREQEYVLAFSAGYLQAAPALMSASGRQLRAALIALAMDAVEKSGYRGRKYWLTHPEWKERDLKKQAFYLMSMPRVQRELDRIYSRQGMSKDRMAACLAEIMEGKATTETRVYDGEGDLKQRTVQTVSASERMKAIDMTIRATTGYAATNSRVSIEAGTMYDSDAWDDVPAIAVDAGVLEGGSGSLPKRDSEEDEADQESYDEPEGDSEEEDGDDEEFDDDDLEEDEE